MDSATAAGYPRHIKVDAKLFKRLGSSRACPSCVTPTTTYLEKATNQARDFCNICGRAWYAKAPIPE